MKDIKVTVKPSTAENKFAKDDWRKDATAYSVKIGYKGRGFSLQFYVGKGWKRAPESGDILPNIQSDAMAGELSFEDFCSEFGYDEDSRNAEKTWKACQKIRKSLARVFGRDFKKFMEFNFEDEDAEESA